MAWYFRGTREEFRVAVKKNREQLEAAEAVIERRYYRPETVSDAERDAAHRIIHRHKAFKDQAFTTSLQDAARYGRFVFAIDLPHEVAHRFFCQAPVLSPGGPCLLIPGEELAGLADRFSTATYQLRPESRVA